MAITIGEIEKQLVELQKIIDSMKESKMQISRHFTGQYFESYNNKQYRRIECNNISIWEYYEDPQTGWVILEKIDSDKLEKIYTQDCILIPEDIKSFKTK